MNYYATLMLDGCSLTNTSNDKVVGFKDVSMVWGQQTFYDGKIKLCMTVC